MRSLSLGFLHLKMEYALDKALQEMTLEEDKPIVLQNLPKYSSCQRNECSIIGRLLCPENQKMSSMIHEMSRLWRVYNRTRGFALPNDRFQFVFDSETELETVLTAGAWTFNDWSLTLERWVENPSDDYLKILPIWIRLRNIPVNYNTAETIQEIAEHIGQVTHVAFDPLKPHNRGFVRVRVLFDTTRPLKNSRKLQLPSGEIVDIGIEYERIRKRCYQCQRLTHDKERCPFNPSNRQVIATEGVISASHVPHRLIPRISKDDPLFGVLTDDDVGLDVNTGRPKIAKDVLDEMRQYLSVGDPADKKIHIERVRRSVWGLAGDPQGQKIFLRLEAPTKFTTNVDKDKGLVFDFEGATSTPVGENLMSTPLLSGKTKDRLTTAVPSCSPTFTTASQNVQDSSTGFNGSFSATSSGTNPKLVKKRRRPNQWKRKAHALHLSRMKTAEHAQESDEGGSSKRKATEGENVSSKIAKCGEVKVVPHAEPPQQR